MELNIIENRDNPLLERNDVFGTAKYNGATPKKEELEEELSKKLKVKKTQIDLIYLRSKFGKTEIEFKAKVYKKPIKEEPKNEENKETSENTEAKGTEENKE